MCRFNSGVRGSHLAYNPDVYVSYTQQFFYLHELLRPYKYYWRVE